MTQTDIHDYYREHWDEVEQRTSAGDQGSLRYSSPIEDATIYPIYERLIHDLGIRVNNGRVLDIGCGSGRWVRFFLERFTPASILAMDFAEGSVSMLDAWAKTIKTSAALSFQHADITAEKAPVTGSFDLINIANVLFHIPEAEKFERALANVASLLDEHGRAVTTEYLPRTSMRTEWMLVRSRYEFEAACQRAGLEIAEVRACSFFSNDPMGIDGPEPGMRHRFNTVRAMSQELLSSVNSDEGRAYITRLLAEIEHACLDFCAERSAQIDMPAQKLVVLRRR